MCSLKLESDSEIMVGEAYFVGDGRGTLLVTAFRYLCEEWGKSGEKAPIYRKDESAHRYAEYFEQYGPGYIASNVGIRMQGENFLFEENPFPYNAVPGVGEGIGHFCLWSKDGQPLSKENVEIILRQKGYQDNKILVFVNDMSHQSVPERWHAQIFILKK